MENEITLGEKIELRQSAIRSALQINPNQTTYEPNYGQGSSLSSTTSPSAEKIITDADKFYAWLTKDL